MVSLLSPLLPLLIPFAIPRLPDGSASSVRQSPSSPLSLLICLELARCDLDIVLVVVVLVPVHGILQTLAMRGASVSRRRLAGVVMS